MLGAVVLYVFDSVPMYIGRHVPVLKTCPCLSISHIPSWDGWVLFPTLSLTQHVTLGKLLNPSLPLFVPG